MFQATINTDHQLTLESDQFDWDLAAINDRTFHILHQNRSYEATVLSADYATKTFEIRLTKTTYTVHLKDHFDQLAEKLGFDSDAGQAFNQVKAPMPGLVLDVLVQEGDVVNKGDSVLILEAMKMENVIKAEGTATVKAIRFNKGDAVEKNAILIELEA